MLKISKSAIVSGQSIIDDIEVASFYGTIGDDEYVNMNMVNVDAYMNNTDEVSNDQQEFMKRYQELKNEISPRLQTKGDETAE